MRNFLRNAVLCAAILFIVSCSASRKTTSYDPYELAPADTMEIPEDAIVVTPTEYRSSFSIVNDLVHTKLDVAFNWEKEQLRGKAWIILKPHFYSTDSLKLDAKGYDLNKVELVKAGGNIPLKYSYDSSFINIKLDKTYAKDESYTVYVDYVANPSTLKVQGSEAINDARGLYFINADGNDPDKPRQLWTQGETESNSCWFPTIDKPNMKMTWEISMTVENGFVTLSNGLMTSSKDNGNGTHTDNWKLDLPFAPYLAMMAAGPFAVVKDKYKNMEVNYYVDKKYEPYARDIFGHTPEMIDFFATRLGVPYAWPKYSQAIVHDFVSGAMENVTATVHYEKLNQTKREMIDGNKEDIISHELFHQWFGDLVTTESWSNISLNESFATYGEYLWNEHKYGRDAADYGAYNDLQAYLNQSKSTLEPLIRFHYESREDVFDATSYQKGGLILHMLRNAVGEEAFFASLKKYLDDNRFSTGEVHQLRLAFEKVTGQDLNWFFNQWYLSKGHPYLSISYYYDGEEKMEYVNINQLQSTDDGIPVYRLPIAIDIYSGGKVTRQKVTVEDQYQTFTFPASSKPDLVNVDADKMLVCEKMDLKTDTAFAFQMEHAPLFLDRLEAMQYFAGNSESPYYEKAVLKGMSDSYWDIRSAAIDAAYFTVNADPVSPIQQKIVALAKTDGSSKVRASAISHIALWEDKSMLPLLENALKDSSYLVIATALDALSKTDSVKAYQAAQVLEKDPSEEIVAALSGLYSKMGGPEKNAWFLKELSKSDVSYYTVSDYAYYLSRHIEHPEIVKSGVTKLDEVARKNSTWYVRFAATMSMESMLIAMDTKKEEWSNELRQPGLSADSKNTLTSNIDWVVNEMSVVSENINEIKSGEQNEMLKSMYNLH